MTGDPGEPFTLAIDDADSPWGGCTTHLLLGFLASHHRLLLLVDYPLLVRLAPGVPRKTRGNAAVALRGYSRVPLEDLLALAYEEAGAYASRRPPGKSPGVAVAPGWDAWRDPGLRALYLEALRGYMPRGHAIEAARRRGVLVAGGTGAVGAAAALAALAPWDPYTYELIAYRDGGGRCLDPDPAAESRVPDGCGGNYDLYTRRPAAAPGGPDPVLAGFRGSRRVCLQAYTGLLCSRPRGWVLYRSNQHTGAHTRAYGAARPYASLRLHGLVESTPRVLPGGHVLVEVAGATVAFYRETGPLARAARLLEPGDEVIVEGVLVPRGRGLTLAAEALWARGPGARVLRVAPRCPRCGSRMKSLGRGKGYRCPRCGYRDPGARPLELRAPRKAPAGRVTAATSGARHLTRLPWLPPAMGWEPLDPPLPASCFYSTTSEPPPVLGGDCKPGVTDPPVSSGAHW